MGLITITLTTILLIAIRGQSWTGYNTTHLKKCSGNTACALSTAMVENMDTKDYLICHAIHSVWSIVPLTYNTAKTINMNNVKSNQTCTLPITIMKILALGDWHKGGPQLWNRNNGVVTVSNACELSTKRTDLEEVRVQWKMGDTCVCSQNGNYKMGNSVCKTMIDVTRTRNGLKCSIREMNVSGYCPFSELFTSDKTPLYWVCGGKGVTTFPTDFAWSGCCYTAIVAPRIHFVELPSSHFVQTEERTAYIQRIHPCRSMDITSDECRLGNVPLWGSGCCLAKDKWTGFDVRTNEE